MKRAIRVALTLLLAVALFSGCTPPTIQYEELVTLTDHSSPYLFKICLGKVIFSDGCQKNIRGKSAISHRKSRSGTEYLGNGTPTMRPLNISENP